MSSPPPNIEFQTIQGPDVTDYTLQSVLSLFNSHYGRYGAHAEELNPYLIPGTQVQLSLSRLRHLNLSDVDVCELGLAYSGDLLVGCAFSTRWKYRVDGEERDSTVCWFTLVVVHKSFRDQGLATTLINRLLRPTDRFWGIASWSAAGAKALYRATKSAPIDELDTSVIQTHAKGVLKRCEITPLREARLEGSLFGTEPEKEMRGVVSCINTRNFVDLEDVEAGIRRAKRYGKWPLGKLPEGGEFLVLVENREVEGN